MNSPRKVNHSDIHPWVQPLIERLDALIAGEHSTPPAKREWILAALGVVLGLFSFWIKGYTPMSENAIFQTPMLEGLLHPELFPNDPLVGVVSNYYSLLWLVLVQVAQWIPLSVALRAGYVLQQVLFFYAIVALGFRLCRNWFFTALLGVFFLSELRPALGGSYFNVTSLSHTSLSIPLLLLAAAFLVRGSVLGAAVVWAFAANIHFPNAIYSAPIIGALGLHRLLASPEPGRSATGKWIEMALAVIVVSASFYPILASHRMGAPETAPLDYALFRDLGNTYIARHMFFDAHFQGRPSLVLFALQVAMACTALWHLRRLHPTFRFFSLGYAMLFAVVGIGIYANAVCSVELTRMMWLRAGDFITLFGLLFSMLLAAQWARGGLPLARAGFPLYLYFLLESMQGRFGKQSACAIALLVLWASAVAHPLWNRRQALRIAVQTRLRHWLGPQLSTTPYPLVILLLVCVAAGGGARQLIREESSAGQKRVEVSEKEKSIRAWYNVQKWARDNTPPGTRFLTPIHMEGWRLRSLRPTFLEVRDANNIVLNVALAHEYMRRLELLGIAPADYKRLLPDGRELYMALTPERMLSLMRQENLRYAVLLTEQKSDWPVAYSNRYYKIVERPE